MRLVFSILLISFGTAFSQTNCAKYPPNYIPIDLDDALIYLNCIWLEKDKEGFKSQPESEAVAKLHFGTGLSIRNGWNLWDGKNSLVQYFKALGIFHPDDISSIILTSFHRQLSGKEINLDQQVSFYKNYWNKIEQMELDHYKMYKSINIGDTVNIYFSKDATDNSSLLFLLYQKSFNYPTSCLVKGMVLEKQKKRKRRLLTIQVVTSNCGNSYLKNTETKMIKDEKFIYDMIYYNLSRN